MSIEALWYASYADGRHPKCNRLTRLPPHQQLGMAFDLALDFPIGRAGYRSVGEIQATGETYWWWPRPNVKHGDWWMLPKRTIHTMHRATKYAEARARSIASDPSAWRPQLSYGDAVRVELRRLQRHAHRAARAVANRDIPEYVARSAKLNKLAASITPQPSAVSLGFRRRMRIVEEYGRGGRPQTREQWERWA